MTLIELLVVSTILVLIASLTLPVSQIIRQRDKESRLREILRQVRDQGIGLGTQSGGYANYVNYYLNTAIDPNLPNDASRSHAIASGLQLGLSYPRTPTLLENPIGEVLHFPTDNSGGSVTVTIPRRFIRKIPPHPFADWYPGVRWEFRIISSDTGAGLTSEWYASETGDPW
ncbi:MAG TPA: type II secretion system protein, partial [Candidatus Ozemobacteraceae bacterium]|nr:type II secretion system protein [Candidatus Ozemobacteraceae bacterium]